MAIPDILQQAVTGGVFPGAVVGFWDGQAEVPEFWSEGALVETVYDVASVTKSVVTATLALQKIDRGEWRLSDKLVELWPALEQFSNMSDICLSHVLTHTVPFAIQLSTLKNLSAAEIKERVLAAPLLAPPGSRYAYINATSMVLGWLLEELSGQGLATARRPSATLRLAELFAEQVADPLGMTSTTFVPAQMGDAYMQRVAPTEIDPWRGHGSEAVRGQVHDESAWVFSQVGQAVGSAGLFTTAADLLKFGRAVLAGQVVSPALAAQLSQPQFPELGLPIGLGWELNQPWMGEHAGPRTIGKTGFTGCSIVIDFDRAKVIVLLSNSTYPHRPATKDGITAVRRAVMSALLE
jgi:CubicO group peptidase (beta-lactamase class C family)